MRARGPPPPSMVVAVTTGCGSVAYTRRQSIKGVVGMTEADTLDELHLLARAAARARGDALFPALTQYVAKALGASESLISQVTDPGHVRTLAVFAHGAAEPNYEYALDGTPCADVIRGDIVHHESGLAEKFPHTARGYEGYFGVPLAAADGTVLGHLCVYDASALPLTQRQRLFCDIF